MNMIKKLDELAPRIHEMLQYPKEWNSLVINKRKPHTFRIFRKFDDIRACCHVFHACEEEDAFAHPHPWPGAFLILGGEYIHTVGFSLDLESQPTFIYKEVVRPFSTYEITHKQLWHKVQPTRTTHTIMINGAEWEGHADTRTTKGKDLESLTPDNLEKQCREFRSLMRRYLDSVEFYH